MTGCVTSHIHRWPDGTLLAYRVAAGMFLPLASKPLEPMGPSLILSHSHESEVVEFQMELVQHDISGFGFYGPMAAARQGRGEEDREHEPTCGRPPASGVQGSSIFPGAVL